MIRTLRLAVLLSCCFAVTATAWAQTNSTDEVIRMRQLHVKMYPEDYAGYDRLGAAYLQKGRETADADYYEKAKLALEKSLDLLSDDPAAASAMTHMAIACMTEHRFEDALSWAQNALALGSGDPSPWAIVGDALADMGDYARAAEAYSRLDNSFGSADEKLGLAYERESRTSFLRIVAGDSQGAIQLMRGALRTAIDTHMPAENIAWSDFQLGEDLFQIGDLDGAEKAYVAALQEYPRYYRGLAGLGKVRAAQGRFSEAAGLYEKAIAVVPYPEYAAALGDVFQKLHQPEAMKKEYDLVEFIGYLNQVNQQIHNRDLALFYADHDLKLEESLVLARRELEVRHDIYTWDVLAWSLFKNGNFHEAADAISNALQQGTKDSQVFFHAGLIYDQLGDSAAARDFLQRALNTNPHFHIFNEEVAKQVLSQIDRESAEIGNNEVRHVP
jgi:tetratricopeptide (TPR) repeat protein